VAIIVCNMSVIIPALLRALGVGDPFMREDTVDPNFSTIEIARATSARIELGLPTTGGSAITDSDESEGPLGTVTSLQLRSVKLGGKDDRKHQLTTQASDGSLRNSNTTKVAQLAYETNIVGSLVQVRSLPTKKQEGAEVDVEDKNEKSNNAQLFLRHAHSMTLPHRPISDTLDRVRSWLQLTMFLHTRSSAPIHSLTPHCIRCTNVAFQPPSFTLCS
jgi:hypothetical protein